MERREAGLQVLYNRIKDERVGPGGVTSVHQPGRMIQRRGSHVVILLQPGGHPCRVGVNPFARL